MGFNGNLVRRVDLVVVPVNMRRAAVPMCVRMTSEDGDTAAQRGVKRIVARVVAMVMVFVIVAVRVFDEAGSVRCDRGGRGRG